MKEFLRTFNILTENEIESATQLITLKTINKSEYFIKEGQTCNTVAFVKTGIFRSFYSSNAGEEITYCITFPNNFLSAYSSYISGQPTPENIQALTSAQLLVIQKNEMEKLAKSSQNWLRFLKVMAEQQYIALEGRIFQLQKDKAKQRYADLLSNQPEYLQNIPLQYLASYLGVTQRHLSRLRKEISF